MKSWRAEIKDGTGGHHVKQNNSETEQVLHFFSHMWKLKK